MTVGLQSPIGDSCPGFLFPKKGLLTTYLMGLLPRIGRLVTSRPLKPFLLSTYSVPGIGQAREVDAV